jgi:PKD repeat protein
LRSLEKDSLTVMLFVILFSSSMGTGNARPTQSSTVSATSSTAVVKVEPARLEYSLYIVGQEFTVSIKVADVTDLYGFDLKLRWNTTILEYVSHTIHVPRNTYSDGILWNPVLQLADTVDQTVGTYRIAYTSMSPAPSFNGTGTVFTMTFRVIYNPTEPESETITKLELYETDLAALGGDQITHNKEHGTVIIRAPKVWVDPALSEYSGNATSLEFTVAVKIVNVTNLYGLGILFGWNTTILDYVSHSVHVPKDTYSDGVLWAPLDSSSIIDEVDTVTGTYHIVYSSIALAPSFNGSGTVFTMKFRIRHHPAEPEPTVVTKFELFETDLIALNNELIPKLTEQGTLVLHQLAKIRLSMEPTFIEFGNATGATIPIPGTQFTLTAKIYNVTNLYGFDVKVRWNTKYLRYVNHIVRVPKNTYPEGVLWNPFIQLADEVNQTGGTYWVACSSLSPALSFNGTGTVFTITFEIINQPFDFETGGPDVDPVDTLLDFESSELAAISGSPTVHSVEPATVRIWERSFSLPPSPLLKVMPTNVEKLPTNSTFEIDLWILGLNQSFDIASFNITLGFNSTLVEAVDITEGTLLKSYASSTIEVLKQINNVTGTATYALEFVPPRKPDPPTIGILFIVTFSVKYESLTNPPPSCELTLNSINVTDRNLGSILITSENGTYTANRPLPVAKFTWSPIGYSVLRGQPVTFNASESYHPLRGKIEFYEWDFGDGTKEKTTEATISHIYLTSGAVTIVLNVTDYGGFWNTQSMKLYIVEPPPSPHLVIDPEYINFGPNYPKVIGQQFNISVYIKNLDAGWNLNTVKLSLSYNATLIDIVGDSTDIKLASLWRGSNDIAVVHSLNMLSKASLALSNPSVTPSGNVLAATVTFTIKYQGTYPKSDMSPLTLGDISLTGILGDIPNEPSTSGQVIILGVTPPIIRVEPSLIEYHENAVGKEFTVSVKIINVTDLYGLDIGLKWNTTALEYVSHAVLVPRNTYSEGVLYNPTLSLINTVNTTSGTYRLACSSMLPAPSFNGTGTVFTMTLRVKYHPVEPEPTANIELELFSTDLVAKDGNTILHSREHGMVTLYQVSPESGNQPSLTPYVVAGIVAAAIIGTISIYIIRIRKPKESSR